MSLVGTRPPTVDEWEQYELHHRSRMSIKPGITGMWQASGRSDITDFEEVVKLDTEYIEKSNIIVYMHSTTFKKEVIKRMGPIIDENCFYVDLEYTIFPLYYIKNFVCLDYIVYQYLLGTDEQSMNIKNMIKRRNQHLIIDLSLMQELFVCIILVSEGKKL